METKSTKVKSQSSRSLKMNARHIHKKSHLILLVKKKIKNKKVGGEKVSY